MSEIAVCLERGSNDQPVGQVRLACGQVADFTGWLALIRILEGELCRLPPSAAVPARLLAQVSQDPSSAG